MAYNKDNDKLIFKFNGGRGAILCSNCYSIIFEGKHIPDIYAIAAREKTLNDPLFCCEDCAKEWQETKK